MSTCGVLIVRFSLSSRVLVDRAQQKYVQNYSKWKSFSSYRYIPHVKQLSLSLIFKLSYHLFTQPVYKSGENYYTFMFMEKNVKAFFGFRGSCREFSKL